MRKLSKDILERAIKTGMKSGGYSGKTLDRRAVEALRGNPQFKKLLSKKSVDQKQVYAALEALKQKGLISERVNEKTLVKKSVAEERKQEQKEKFEEEKTAEEKQGLQERTAKGYLHERQKEEGTDYESIKRARFQRDGKDEDKNSVNSVRGSISAEGEGERRVHLNKEEAKDKNAGWGKKGADWSRKGTGWSQKEEKPPESKPEETPPSAPKDLPI